MDKISRKTDLLSDIWLSLGGGEMSVPLDSLLQRLNGEREFCVHGNLDRKRRVGQVAEVGTNLVNRLGESYPALSDEPGVAAAVMQKLSTLGQNLIAESSP